MMLVKACLIVLAVLVPLCVVGLVVTARLVEATWRDLFGDTFGR